MDRRLLLSVLACAPLALRAQEQARPRHKVSAGELHKALATRFPLRLAMEGLVELNVDAPVLLLLPARNQLGTSLVAQASGPALRRVHTGELDLAFSVRFEPSDRTLRAHRPELLDLRLPSLPPEGVQGFRRLWPALARDAIGEVVLHRFTARELALPDTLGVEPDQLVVQDDGLLVVFAPKRR